MPNEPDLSYLDDFFAKCRAQAARWNERQRPVPRAPGDKGYDPELTNLKVGEGPLPHSWEDGNGNIHFDVKAMHAEFRLPDTQANRDETAAMMAAIMGQKINVRGVTYRRFAPLPSAHN